mgnify:CR=1 FL=1
MKIPRQLQDENYRFYLIKRNEKLPIEKLWNTKNNYVFFDEKLMRHKGNYGVVTGPGNLIVLDFDDINYYNSVVNKLPPTFTVLSARKKLPHMYYLLDGEMFKKVGIDVNGKRVLDIQGDRSGIVGPNSSVDRAYYQVTNSIPIKHITPEVLMAIFKFSPKKRTEFKGETKMLPEEIKKTTEVLALIGLKQTKPLMYKCPFHDMAGTGNLHVLDDGRIYCFHEQKTWNLWGFADEVCRKNGDIALKHALQARRARDEHCR